MSNILTHPIELASGFEQVDISTTDNDPFFRVSKEFSQAIKRDTRLTNSAKLLISEIYEYYLGCKSRRVWVSQKTLARNIGICIRTVRNATNLLVKFGYLAIEKNLLTQTYNYFVKAIRQTNPKDDCCFKQRGKCNPQSRTYTTNTITTNNITKRKELFNTKTEQKQQKTTVNLNGLPPGLAKTMGRLRDSIKNRSPEPEKPPQNPPERVKPDYAPKTPTNQSMATHANTQPARHTSYQSRELVLSARTQRQINALAQRGIALNSSAGTVDELAYRLEAKAREELRLGKAQNLTHSLRMSWALIKNNLLGRYFGTRDEQTIYAQQQYDAHAEQKKRDCWQFTRLRL